MANTVRIQVIGDVSNLKKNLGGAKKEVGTFGKVVKGGAAVAVGGLAAVGVAAAKMGLDRLKGIDTAQAKLRGLGHDAEGVKSIMNNALASVKGTAFGLDSAATTAASAVAAGIKPGKDLTKYLTLTADAATIAGTSMDEMGSIINKVTTSGKAQMDNLNQLSDRGIPIMQWLADEYGVSATELSKMVSEGAVDAKTFRKVIADNIGGAAQESGKTFTGALANMKAALGRIGANALSGAFPKVIAGFGAVTKAMAPLEDAALKIGPAISKAFQSINIGSLTDVLAKARGPLTTLGNAAKETFGAFVDSLPSVKTFLKGVLDVLAPLAAIAAGGAFAVLLGTFNGLTAALQVLSPVLTTVGDFFSNNVETVATFVGILAGYAAVVATVAKVKALWAAAQLALNTALAANPIGIVVVAIAALAAGLVYAYKKSDTFRAVVNGAWAAVRAATAKVFGWMKSFIAGTWAAIQGAFNIVKSIVGMVRGAWNSVKSATTSAWNGIKNAVTNAINGLMNAVRGIRGKVTGALAGIGSWLLSAGSDLIRGMISGIRNMAGALVGAAKDVVGGAINGAKALLGIKSPSRVFKKIGQQTMQGLAIGFRNGKQGVKKALEDSIKYATKRMKKAGFSDDAIEKNVNRMKKWFGANNRTLNRYARKVTRAWNRVSKAQERLADLRKTRADYAKGISDNARAYAGITNLNSAFTPEAMAQQLKARLEKIKQFNALLKDLIAKGLNKDMVAQLAAAGVEGGLAYAQAIASGGTATVQEFNGLQSEITKASNTMGNIAANDMYNAGIAAAQGLVRGLRSKARAITKEARGFARALVKAVKQSLGIKSPSRVFRTLGKQTIAGMEIGLADTTGVKKSMVNLSKTMTKAYDPNLTALAKPGKANGQTHITIQVNVPATADKAAVGREITQAIDAYYKQGGRRLNL